MHNKPLIKAAIFDMDGLLIDSEPFWRAAEIKVFTALGFPMTEADCEICIGWRIDEVVQYWQSKLTKGFVSVAETVQSIEAEVIRLVKTSGEAKPGAIELLQQLHALNVPICIASSSYYAIINAVVERLKIEPYLQFVYSAQEEALGKPHPGVFISAANKLNIEPTSCIVFEDSKYGVIAGLAAKMHVVAVPDKDWWHQPIYDSAFQKLKSLADFTIDSIQLN